MIVYYAVMAGLTLAGLLVLMCSYELKKLNHYSVVVQLLMTLANGGYLALAMSKTITEAALANKLCYLGGCFIPPLWLLLICTVCNFQMKRTVKILLYGYSFIVYAMVLSIGYSNFYYDDMFLELYKDATVLGHTYGPGHAFFYVILYGYMIIQIALLIYTMIKKRAVSRKNLWALIVMELVNVGSFMVGRWLNSAVEIMPFMYVLDTIILLYLQYRGFLYNVEDNFADNFAKQETYGYLMLDNQWRYLGCNPMVEKIIPAVSDCVIDRSIKDVIGMETVKDWLKQYSATGKEYYEYEYKEKHYECRVERICYREHPLGYMVELQEDTVKELFIQTVTALSEAVDAKDRYTSGHSRRVAEYARKIAARMGKSKEEQEEIYRAGLLHDVGKIRIPAEIINKPGKLTEEEYNIIKIHPVTGYHILQGISEESEIAIAAKYHHERFDGKGYPNGLAGENIPEVARILGVADSYDAMASNRSYRNALPQEVVQGEIKKGRGTQFDPQIADIMLQMMDEDTEYSMKETESSKKRVLTVDDEPMNNKIIVHIMKDEPKYEMVTAESGMDALELLNNQEFDLILLDVKMPEMDGLETLRKIREKYRTPVVLMTSDKTLEAATEFAELGCDDYVTKPVLPLLIKEIVHTMTERKNSL